MENAVYIAIGIRLDGKKEVMGMYIGWNESAEYWLGVLNDLKARGVQEILVCCVNGLSGFCDDIASVYPWTDVCVVSSKNGEKFHSISREVSSFRIIA